MDIRQYISSGIIESYVMGLCSDVELMEMEQLRLQYPELDEAIGRFEEELEKNMQQHSSLPGDDVDRRILGTLSQMNSDARGFSINKKSTGWIKPLAAAASILLLISTGFNYYFYRKIKKQLPVTANITLPEKDYAVMNDPKITPVAMYGVGYHSICRCTMFWDKNTGKMYIMIHHLPRSTNGKNYQLWATVDGKAVSVGIVQDEIRGRFIEMNKVPAAATGFLVTLEKAGGTSSPTEEEAYLKGVI
jgi:anti-sigma-K factor RskA